MTVNVGSIKESAGDVASNRFFTMVRDNAIPAAMISIGMYLLLRTHSDDEDVPATTDYSSYRVSSGTDFDVEKGSRVKEKARSSMRAASTQTHDFVNGRPLVAGVAALALGALVGALIPETEKEHELLGAKRDELAQKAKDAMRNGVAKARDMASNAVSAATDAARNSVQNSNRTDVGENIGIVSDSDA